MARIRQAAIGNICDDVKTITERNIHPVQLHNSKFFHAAHNPEPEVDEAMLGGINGRTDLHANQLKWQIACAWRIGRLQMT